MGTAACRSAVARVTSRASPAASCGAVTGTSARLRCTSPTWSNLTPDQHGASPNRVTSIRLGVDGGARVELRNVGYQYPDNVGDGSGRDWDANWLVVAGDAVTDDGRSWSFRDPCLTTWEARSLGEWLGAVADGSMPPSPFDGSKAERLLVFTEPNVAFSLEARSGEDVVIRVHLSLESRPPWFGPGDPDIFDYYLSVTTSAADLAVAVAEWDRMVALYPGR